MTVVVLGIDALDPELVDLGNYPNLSLDRYKSIQTITSTAGEPSTHELWPTIITGLSPAEHGLTLDQGVAWENPLLRAASSVANYVLPEPVQTKLGAWLLTNTTADAFRIPRSYYPENGLSTLFDGVASRAIGIPNYVADSDSEDREHQLRRNLGTLFERDPDSRGGHTSSDVGEFYERCLEMAMIRTVRVRRAVRSRQFELVFGYTSGLDLIGHVTHDRPEMQRRAYTELDEFVGELHDDLHEEDVLVLVSDHGLQDGLHTEEAMVASTQPTIVETIDGVTDVREAVETELSQGDHESGSLWETDRSSGPQSEEVAQQLEDLGYM